MSDSKKLEIDQQVVDRLATVVESLTKVLDRTVKKDGAVTLSGGDQDNERLREDLRTVRDTIRHIAKVLHEGNGEKPLISRVDILETNVNHLGGRIEGIEEDIQTLEQQNLKTSNLEAQAKKGKYAVAAAVVSGGAGLVTAIISLLGS